MGFINLLIREKVIDFFIIISFFSITFFLSFLSYSLYLPYSPRYNKAYTKTYVKADKACDNAYDNLSYLFYPSRLSRYNKVYVEACVKVYVKVYKICDNSCDRYYYYNKMRFNDINKFNIKALFPPFLSLSSYSFYSPRYNRAYGKACVEAYAKVDKAYDDICDRYYYYNEKRFNNINKFNVKDIINFFLIKLLSLFISLKRDGSR